MYVDIIALRWGIGIFIFFIVAWIIMAKMLLKSEPKVIKVNMADRYDDISEQELKKFGIDSSCFKRMAYEKFKNIHNALVNYDYVGLQKDLTNDLYQYYIEQLDAMKKIKCNNIMKDFELVSIKIYKISNEYNLLRISLYLNVRMLDYVVDIDTCECIKGSSVDKKDFEFEFCLEKRGKGKSLYDKYVMSKKSCINDMIIKPDKKDNLLNKIN